MYIGEITANKGESKSIYPFKLTIKDKGAIKVLKELEGDEMFSWVYRTKEDALKELENLTNIVRGLNFIKGTDLAENIRATIKHNKSLYR